MREAHRTAESKDPYPSQKSPARLRGRRRRFQI